jgi:hypothetical protein
MPAKKNDVTFRSVLLTVNLFLLGTAGLFVGSQRPGGNAGQMLAFACVLAQVVTIKGLVRSRGERKRRAAIMRDGDRQSIALEE